MKIDDATQVEMVDDGEWSNTKEPIIEVEALDVEVEEYTLEKESNLVSSRVETRTMSGMASPLTPLEVHPPISRNDEVSTSKKPSS